MLEGAHHAKQGRHTEQVRTPDILEGVGGAGLGDIEQHEGFGQPGSFCRCRLLSFFK